MSTHVIHESRVLTVMTRLWQWGIASWIFLIHLYVTPIVCGFSSMTSYKFEPEPLQRHYRRLHFKLPLILMFCFFVLNEHQVVKWGGGCCVSLRTASQGLLRWWGWRRWGRSEAGFGSSCETQCVKPAWWKVSRDDATQWGCQCSGLRGVNLPWEVLTDSFLDWFDSPFNPFASQLGGRPFTREELKTKANKNYNKKQKKPRRWITWPITWVGCEFRGGWFRATVVASDVFRQPVVVMHCKCVVDFRPLWSVLLHTALDERCQKPPERPSCSRMLVPFMFSAHLASAKWRQEDTKYIPLLESALAER